MNSFITFLNNSYLGAQNDLNADGAQNKTFKSIFYAIMHSLIFYTYIIQNYIKVSFLENKLLIQNII